MAPVGAEGVVNAAEEDMPLLQQIHAAQAAAVGNSAWDTQLGWAHAKVKGYELHDRVVVHSHGEGQGYKLVIPADEALHKELLWQHHNCPHAGYLGLYRMVGALSYHYYWRGLYTDCKSYCR